MVITQKNKFMFFYVIGIFSILAGYFRLWVGVDFLDEAWYVAVTQQFSLGAKPFGC